MKKETFDLLRDVEKSWLYRGRTEVVKKLVDIFKNGRGDFQSLDMGAGFGGFFETLANFGPVDAVEPNPEAKNSCLKRGYRRVFESLDEIGANTKYDVIIACDVIEHIKDDAEILGRIKGGLKENGILVLTVPAFNFLWAKRDDDHGHFRRYTKKTLREAISKSSLKLNYISYWNFILFPLAMAVRLTGGSGDSSLDTPNFVNGFLMALLRIEIALMPAISFPYGLTLVAVASSK